MKNENEVVVGIDCGSEKHQYQMSTKTGVTLSRGYILNSKKAAKVLVKKVVSVADKSNVIMGIEATDTYHICLQKYLVSNGFKVVVINPLKTSAYNKIDDYGNKTDPIDANGICQFLIDGKHKKIKQMNQKYLKLRELCRCWQKLQSDTVRVSLRLQTRLVIINPEFKQYLYKPLCKSAIYLLENYQTPDTLATVKVDKLQEELKKISHGLGRKDRAERIVKLARESFGVKDDIEGYIRYVQHHLEEYKFLKKKILEIKKEIRTETKEDYCKKEIEIINSIRGLGIEVSAGILSELGDINNFEKISSIVRFAGMIALKKQSGKTQGKSKMSKQGSKYLRNYLHQAVMGAKLHSVTFSAIYANKCMKIKDLDPESKKIAKAKIKGNLARRILETIAICLMKDRLFDDRIAFDSIQLDDFIRQTFVQQFQKNK